MKTRSLTTALICLSLAVAPAMGRDGESLEMFDDDLLPEAEVPWDEDALLDPYEEASGAGSSLVMPGDDPYELIFYHYGTACFGLDWRFLEAVARVESGLDPQQRTGSYIGLFQWSKSACDEPQNMGPFKSFLNCSDLTDPEANTLVSAHRFNRMFWGERFIDGELQRDSSWPDPMLEVCPSDTGVSALAALAYVGHNNGPGVLKYVLSYLKRRDAGCELDVQEAAVRSYYEHSSGARAATAEDVARCNERSTVKGRPTRVLEVGTRHRKCVNANYGAEKWRYGVRKILPQIEVSGVADLYPEDAMYEDDCPIYDGARVYDDWAWTLLE